MERGDLRILQLEERLNSLHTKISELERRIMALERNLPPPKPSPQKPTQPVPDSVQQKKDAGHRYLSRAINLAKRDYDQKYK
ncbi:MAG: hypothetical protein QW315_04890 [Candidatus Hadarchaeum sp.]